MPLSKVMSEPKGKKGRVAGIRLTTTRSNVRSKREKGTAKRETRSFVPSGHVGNKKKRKEALSSSKKKEGARGKGRGTRVTSFLPRHGGTK